jgi:hypothetical protein
MMPRSSTPNRARLIFSVPQRVPSVPPREDDGWPFFPSYNPLEYDPPAVDPSRRERLAVEAKRITIGTLWRTALFFVAVEVAYFVSVSEGWLAEVVR